jgi:pilus assembly protein Flp/PilA
MRQLAGLYGRLVRDRKGATAVEYGFIVALIVIAIIASIQGLAGANTEIWTNVHDKVRKVG